jgi:hypothetical protein
VAEWRRVEATPRERDARQRRAVAHVMESPAGGAAAGGAPGPARVLRCSAAPRSPSASECRDPRPHRHFSLAISRFRDDLAFAHARCRWADAAYAAAWSMEPREQTHGGKGTVRALASVRIVKNEHFDKLDDSATLAERYCILWLLCPLTSEFL